MIASGWNTTSVTFGTRRTLLATFQAAGFGEDGANPGSVTLGLVLMTLRAISARAGRGHSVNQRNDDEGRDQAEEETAGSAEEEMEGDVG